LTIQQTSTLGVYKPKHCIDRHAYMLLGTCIIDLL
jgi:hypothetical protein